MRILVVEDDPRLAATLKARLEGAGYVVDHVASAGDARAAVITAPYELVLLDRRLPDGDGLRHIADLRRARPQIRIVVLTALDAKRDTIVGLDAGADDYLTKPFDPDELLARVRAALRRPGASVQPAILCGNLRYDPAHRAFTVDETPLVLKRRESLILEALMLRARRVVQRHAFMDQVYGIDDEIRSNTLDAQISRLRTRLAEAGATVRIHAVRGVGYLLGERPLP